MNWPELGKLLSARLDIEVGELAVRSASGGNINQAFRVEGRNCQFFVKTNRAELLSMFEAEQAGLDAIRATDTIRAPEVLITGADGSQAYIVMEYIELGGSPNAERLALALAGMHSSIEEHFGFHIDNTIGSTPQRNTPNRNWVEFWQRHRLGFLLELATERGFSTDLIDAGHRLNEVVGRFFAAYQPRASLLHGDLWSGNWSADSAGNPVIYDPACYYGDHEADLAMMELFGHPGEAFFTAYRERFPIDVGYAERRDLYNLYHIFNHALLFGGSYLSQTRQLIARLQARI